MLVCIYARPKHTALTSISYANPVKGVFITHDLIMMDVCEAVWTPTFLGPTDFISYTSIV